MLLVANDDDEWLCLLCFFYVTQHAQKPATCHVICGSGIISQEILSDTQHAHWKLDFFRRIIFLFLHQPLFLKGCYEVAPYSFFYYTNYASLRWQKL